MGKNAIEIDGRLTRDSEQGTTANGKKWIRFSLAVSHGEGKDASFFDFQGWGDIANESLHKGDLVSVKGWLKQDRWVDKSTGSTRSKVIIMINSLNRLMFKENGHEPTPDAPFEDDCPF